MNVLLTSVGRRNYLVDYFKDAIAPYSGKVFAVNSHTNAPALYRADGYQLAPPIYSEAYVPFLLEFCEKEKIQLLVPLLDNDLPVLAAAKSQFAALGVYVLVPDLETSKLSNDKYSTYAFLQKNGLETVPTFADLEEFRSAFSRAEINFPVVIKPRWGMGSLSVYIADNEEELEFYFKKAKKEVLSSFLKFESEQDPGRELLIMEKISGDEYMLDIINDLDGNHQVTVVNKKLLRKGGETEAVETVSFPELEKLGREIADLFRHPLVMDADVIVNDRGSFILEFNPRFSGGYPFSHLAGINLPKALIQWVKSEEVSTGELLVPKIGTISMKGIVMISADPALRLPQSEDLINGQIVSATIL